MNEPTHRQIIYHVELVTLADPGETYHRTMTIRLAWGGGVRRAVRAARHVGFAAGFASPFALACGPSRSGNDAGSATTSVACDDYFNAAFATACPGALVPTAELERRRARFAQERREGDPIVPFSG
jgi:hypothetical protein